MLKFQGETAHFSEKFRGEIQVFPGEIEGFPEEISHYFSQKKRQLIMEKNKKWGFSLPSLYLSSITPTWYPPTCPISRVELK